MGLLWLSTVPPTSGLVAVMFGTRHVGMLFGFVFLSHQVGAFIGVWLGGVVYEATGAYDLMWWLSIALALAAAMVHLPILERRAPRVGAEHRMKLRRHLLIVLVLGVARVRRRRLQAARRPGDSSPASTLPPGLPAALAGSIPDARGTAQACRIEGENA